MKVSVNGMVIEGTPQEVTAFLKMNKMLPAEQAEKLEVAVPQSSFVNLLLYREMGRKKYQSNIL